MIDTDNIQALFVNNNTGHINMHDSVCMSNHYEDNHFEEKKVDGDEEDFGKEIPFSEDNDCLVTRNTKTWMIRMF
jgi:hypothetical protein